MFGGPSLKAKGSFGGCGSHDGSWISGFWAWPSTQLMRTGCNFRTEYTPPNQPGN